MTKDTTNQRTVNQSELLEKSNLANAYHDRGFNCAQAVACAFKDKTGLDEGTLFRMTEGLGLGMGCMEGTCGAISAAVILSGLKCSTGHTDKPDSKGATYKAAASCIHAFKDKNGSIICRELKGAGTGAPLRSCPDCIRDAVEIIEEHLFSGNKPNGESTPLPPLP